MELPIRRESSKMPLRLENVSFSYKNNDKNEKPVNYSRFLYRYYRLSRVFAI